jgi:hypothetical protein
MKKTNSEVLNPNDKIEKVQSTGQCTTEAPDVVRLMLGLISPKDETENKKVSSFKYWHMKAKKENEIFNNVRS